MNYDQVFQTHWWIWTLLALWVLPWKGVALWRAAKNSHLKWFIAILVLNTLALLEIFYIFVIGRKKKREINQSQKNLRESQ